MTSKTGIVYLVDDEPDVLKALTRLLRSKLFEVRGFTSAGEFLAAYNPREVACLVLDVSMPGLNGLELQQRLTEQGLLIPIIFLTGHGDIPTTVRAIKAGAMEFLTKPVEASTLVRAVHAALAAAAERRERIAEMAALSARFGALTPRQRQVLEHLLEGRLNKQIAAELGTGEANIKIHRGLVMKKMGVESLAQLARAVERLRGAK